VDSASHAAQRELLSPAFRSDYVRALVPMMAGVSGEMADALLASAGNPVEVQVMISQWILVWIGMSQTFHRGNAKK
jgi:cytochrome P450